MSPRDAAGTTAAGRPAGLAGLLDTSADPADRLVLALTALHATNGTDLRNLALADLLLPCGQLCSVAPTAAA